MPCEHTSLIFDPSQHATAAGFRRATLAQRLAATTHSGKVVDIPQNTDVPSSIFPSPLVLPGDDLANDPRCPAQSFRSWIRLKDRNQVTSSRNVIYVAGPPDIRGSASFMKTWTRADDNGSGLSPSAFVGEVMSYLKAFYTGITVKRLTSPSLHFESWGDGKPSSRKIPQYVGLNIGQEMVGIRARPSPDRVFPAQLNVDDLIEGAISSLPQDAYCLLVLVDQDIYEDEEDTFVCGRAYGGSRVAVVSTARYNPGLDDKQGVDREHAWPASHCRDFVMKYQSDVHPRKKAKTEEEDPRPSSTSLASPMYSALRAYKNSPDSSSSPATLSGLWLGRICRTASHELGHCFGIDHCVYYACVMQSTSNISEDHRQPPFLCPVDLAKVLHASGRTAAEHYRELLSFCERYPEAQIFNSFAAWLRVQLALM